MERFGSFLGSIPTIGAAVPLGILLVFLMPMTPPLRIGLLVVLGAGIFASLSKQATSGTLFALALGLLLGRKKRIATVGWILLWSVVVYAVLDFADIPL